MTERLPFHFSLSCIGEGNGNPLQCSFLENPRDGGAWWAAVYGVTQSWTRLKGLSSPSSTLVSALKTKVVTPVPISLYPKLYVANHGGNVLLLLLLSRFSHVQLCATS